MAVRLEAPHIPKVFHTHGTLPPKYNALLVCIGYSSCPAGSDPGNRLVPLTGPLNDAKEMKTALIGGLIVYSTTAFSPLSRSIIDLFRYREVDIFVMTDEQKNVGTEHWPSKENIVSYFFFLSRGARGCTFTHTGKIN